MDPFLLFILFDVPKILKNVSSYARTKTKTVLKILFLKGLLHDQTKFHKLLLKSEFVKPNSSVQCLSLGKERVRLSSNGARRDEISHLRYICHGCVNNKVENDSKPM